MWIHLAGDSVRDNRELDDEECSLYRAIMVLRVLQLEAEDQDYILEFMVSFMLWPQRGQSFS